MIIERSETFTNLAKAILKVQAAVEGVARDSTNPHFKSRYASLEAVVTTIRPHCVEAGIVVTQAAGEVTDKGHVPVETMLIHAESGEWMKATFALPSSKADAQGFGSAISYASRYSLMAMFNIPPTDDDGEAAVQPEKKSSYRSKKDGDWDFVSEIKAITSLDALVEWRKQNTDKLRSFPKQWFDTFEQEVYNPKVEELRKSVPKKLSPTDSSALLKSMATMMERMTTRSELKSWAGDPQVKASVATMQEDDAMTMRETYEARLDDLPVN